MSQWVKSDSERVSQWVSIWVSKSESDWVSQSVIELVNEKESAWIIQCVMHCVTRWLHQLSEPVSHTCHMSRRDRKIPEIWSLKICPGGTPFFPENLLCPRFLVACQIHSILRLLEWPNSNQDQLYGQVPGRHTYRIYLTPVHRCGEVFRQSLIATTKSIAISKQLFNLITQAQ